MWGQLVVAIIADTWILGKCCADRWESAFCNKPLLSSERIFSDMREAMMDVVLLLREIHNIVQKRRMPTMQIVFGLGIRSGEHDNSE